LITASRVGIVEEKDEKVREMRKADKILSLIQERGKKDLPVERVYRLLFNRDLYLKAYGKIYRNKGAMTHGVTDETPDGMSLEDIDSIIEAIRYERFQWLPVRRVSIPKKNGKKRPLGLPDWSAKLVQEVIRLILEAYYEPRFSEHSHGFRPQRGCHTALREIYYKWSGTVWFIEGDISKCFDHLSHELLLKELREHFHDERFIRLIEGLLKAGYMEDWTYNETLSGTPQGGIVSPILANILMDKLDKFVETTLIPQYTKGTKRQKNQEYHKLLKKSHRQLQKGSPEEAERLRRQAQTMPSLDTHDPNFRRLRYVRYADDFLLGFIGPKAEAEEIKQQLRTFLQEQLKLELSEEKTLITHAKSEAARFLSYEITTIHDDAQRNNRGDTFGNRRNINGIIGLRIPRDILEAKCREYERKEKAKNRAELIHLSDYDIVKTYQLEYRGVANYYQLAYNMKTLNKVKYVMETSLLKTLAAKHKSTVNAMASRYKARMTVDGKSYAVLQVIQPQPDKKPLIATWGGIPLIWNIRATIEDQPSQWYAPYSELEQRLLNNICGWCGSQDIEMHHVRAMKDLHEYPGRPKPEWVKRMIALRRKTIPLCRSCHMDVQYGRPMRREPISLEEFKALQKEATKKLLMQGR
jgi:group II intron reverse transcriptase/maturase